MYTGPIIDTHIHLWDLANGYDWLSHRDPATERLIGDYGALRRNFLVPDYLRLTRARNVVKAVSVQTPGFPDDPVRESEWVQRQADQYGFPQGVVAYANLTDPSIGETLRKHRQRTNVRGIRMPLNFDPQPWRRMCDRPDYMADEQWRKGFALLSVEGLSFDLQMYDHQAPAAVALARDFPGTTIVIEHLAWPLDLSTDGFERWSQRLSSLAGCHNVFLKISGVGAVFGRSAPDLIQKYLRRAVEVFS